MKTIKVLLGNASVEFTRNGSFVTRRTIIVNPKADLNAQIESYIESDITLRGRLYDWKMCGEVYEYAAIMKVSKEGFMQLREQGYSFEEIPGAKWGKRKNSK